MTTKTKEIMDAAIDAAIGEGLRNVVRLPGNYFTNVDFAQTIIKHQEERKINLNIYYREKTGELIEPVNNLDIIQKKQNTRIQVITPIRLLNILEETFTFCIMAEKEKTKKRTKKQQKKEEELPKLPKRIWRSPNEQHVKVLMNNTQFLKQIPIINRILTSPLIFKDENGKIILPKKGYDERFQAYTLQDTPQPKKIDIKKAKNTIKDILSEFCFKEKIDEEMAIAYLLTPGCRGIYKNITNRTPLFIIMANQARAGKDYLAGVIGIIYEGIALDDPAFVTESRNDSNEELRKKLTAKLISGVRRIHSSNNRGHLNNPILEGFLTTENWVDRRLGRNEEVSLPNETDVSLSANIGLTFNADIWGRSRPINLFYPDEDPNARTFNRPNLHNYVRENRELILSAIYTLITSWVEAGEPTQNDVIFTSFPEWARVVGGIMTYHKLGNPCTHIDDNAVGGDEETQNMKKLFQVMTIKQRKQEEQKTFIGFKISDIRKHIQELQETEDINIFETWDLEHKATQIKFGLLIQKFLDRQFKINLDDTFINVQLKIYQQNTRSTRTTYRFQLSGHDGHDGLNLTLPSYENNNKNNNNTHIAIGETWPNMTNMTKGNNVDIDSVIDRLGKETIVKGHPEEQVEDVQDEY